MRFLFVIERTHAAEMDLAVDIVNDPAQALFAREAGDFVKYRASFRIIHVIPPRRRLRPASIVASELACT